MGCCGSTTGNSPIQTHSKHSRNLPPANPLSEEESVKEVLSETPTIPRAFRKSNELRKIPYSFPKGLAMAMANPDGKYQLDGFLKNPAKNIHPEQVLSEEVSEEVCSAQSECLSSASFFTELNEENDPEIRRRSPMKMRDRSGSGDFSRVGVIGKSPRAKMNPSPNRVRSGTANRRDYGESSGRRSVSPAMRTGTVQGGKKGLGRSVSAGRNRNGMSSDRVKSEMGGLKIEDRNHRSYKEDHWPPTTDDSLENPLVSLECFIFL